jgi:6-phosphogluconolactonase (cycloisomerase 2 family)
VPQISSFYILDDDEIWVVNLKFSESGGKEAISSSENKEGATNGSTLKASVNRNGTFLLLAGRNHSETELYKIGPKKGKLTKIGEKKQSNHKRNYDNFLNYEHCLFVSKNIFLSINSSKMTIFYHYGPTGYEFINFRNLDTHLKDCQILSAASYYPAEL